MCKGENAGDEETDPGDVYEGIASLTGLYGMDKFMRLRVSRLETEGCKGWRASCSSRMISLRSCCQIPVIHSMKALSNLFEFTYPPLKAFELESQ